jgi:predicted small lipoprotein YifL
MTGMRIALLLLPVVLTVLALAACGGKGGGY